MAKLLPFPKLWAKNKSCCAVVVRIEVTASTHLKIDNMCIVKFLATRCEIFLATIFFDPKAEMLLTDEVG